MAQPGEREPGEPVHVKVRVPMRDGVELATDVVLPPGGGRHPVLVYRTPYGRERSWLAYRPAQTAAAGWAVVVQDVRGRFESDGVFDPWRQEGDDSADTVEWAAAQPWSSGDVFMGGASYMGYAQWLGAARRPKALRGITPMIAGVDFHQGWASEGGVPFRAQLDMWSLNQAVEDRRLPSATRRKAARLVADPAALFFPPRTPSPASAVFPEHAAWMDPPPDADLRHVGWRRRPPLVPAFQVTGWFDMFVESALAGYRAMRAVRDKARPDVAAAQRLIVGPWAHNGALPRRTGEVDYGPKADGLAQGIAGDMFSWMAAIARGEQPAGGARVFVLGLHRWVDLPEWPPPSTPRRLFLADGLVDEPPARQGAFGSFSFDGRDPVPTLGGRSGAPPPWSPGQFDQAPLDDRKDVLSFVSRPLDRPLNIAGTVRARITVASDDGPGVVTAKLVDVHPGPGGKALNLLDAGRLVAFTPGAPQRVAIHLGDIAAVVKRGHRLRLDVSWSNYPRLDLMGMCAGRYTVFGGGRQPSCLELPITDAF